MVGPVRYSPKHGRDTLGCFVTLFSLSATGTIGLAVTGAMMFQRDDVSHDLSNTPTVEINADHASIVQSSPPPIHAQDHFTP